MIAEKLTGAILKFDMTDLYKPKLLYIRPKCQGIRDCSDKEFLADPGLLTEMHAA